MGISMCLYHSCYLSAALSAIVLGLILGRMTFVWGFVDPVVQVLRPVAPIAWAPFIVLWLGIGSAPAIVIIFIAAFFPILLTTVAGVRKVDETSLKLARNLEIKKTHLM